MRRRRVHLRPAEGLDWPRVRLSDTEVAQIEAFLHALTGASVDTLALGVPERVPSGLPVDQPAARGAE